MVLVFVSGFDARLADARLERVLAAACEAPARWYRVRAADDAGTASGFAELASARDAAALAKAIETSPAGDAPKIAAVPEAAAATECAKIADELESDVFKAGAEALARELTGENAEADDRVARAQRGKITEADVAAAVNLAPQSDTMTDAVYADIKEFRYAQARNEVEEDLVRKMTIRTEVNMMKKLEREAQEDHEKARELEKARRAAAENEKVAAAKSDDDDDEEEEGPESAANGEVQVKMRLKKSSKAENVADDILGGAGTGPVAKRPRIDVDSNGAPEGAPEAGTSQSDGSGKAEGGETVAADEAPGAEGGASSRRLESLKRAKAQLEASKVREIASKLIERYFGEPDPDLVEHLVGLQAKGATRDELVAEVQAVLEEDEAKECVDELLRQLEAP